MASDGSTAIPTSVGNLNKGEIAVLGILATRESATTKQVEIHLEEHKLAGYLWESLRRLKDRKLIENVRRTRPRRVGTTVVQEPFTDPEMFKITTAGTTLHDELTSRKAKQQPKEAAKESAKT